MVIAPLIAPALFPYIPENPFVETPEIQIAFKEQVALLDDAFEE